MAMCLESVIENELKSDWPSNISNFNEQNDEILALESFFDSTDNFEILEDASIELSQLYSLQFKIQVNCNEKNLKAEIWLPVEYSSEPVSATASASKLNNNKTKFERSISGKNAYTTINCTFLPHLLMDITLPSTYPTIDKPIYQIKSNWLNLTQLDQLCTKLDEIWNENYNMPVIFTWIEWLQNSLIEHLDIFEEPNKLFITPLESNKPEILNNKIVSLFVSVDDLIFQFLRHNFIEESKQFRKSNQNCLICFDEKIGSEFYRLNDCKHHFCADCLTAMCQIHVKEGTIQLLKCPDKDCKEYVSIDVMKQILSDEEFERWQRLSLQRTLDSMSDVIYCPKCSIPIIVDENDTHSFCLNCNQDYCKLCKSAWHSGNCTTDKMKVEKKLELLKISLQDLLHLTDAQIKERFQSNATVALKVKKEAVIATDGDLTLSVLKKFVRCPKCSALIDKYDGCNKVTCICGAILCYVCGKIITNGYEHFNEANSKCNLWNAVSLINRVNQRPQHDAQRALERVLAAAPEQRRNLINCPSCGQANLKVDKNNHLKCWLCATNFCYCCKKRIVGIITNHFRAATACKQHSDNIETVKVNKPMNKKEDEDDKKLDQDDFKLI